MASLRGQHGAAGGQQSPGFSLPYEELQASEEDYLRQRGHGAAGWHRAWDGGFAGWGGGGGGSFECAAAAEGELEEAEEDGWKGPPAAPPVSQPMPFPWRPQEKGGWGPCPAPRYNLCSGPGGDSPWGKGPGPAWGRGKAVWGKGLDLTGAAWAGGPPKHKVA